MFFSVLLRTPSRACLQREGDLPSLLTVKIHPSPTLPAPASPYRRCVFLERRDPTPPLMIESFPHESPPSVVLVDDCSRKSLPGGRGKSSGPNDPPAPVNRCALTLVGVGVLHILDFHRNDGPDLSFPHRGPFEPFFDFKVPFPPRIGV